MVEQRPQQAIIGPEIMPPFGYAVRLVDGEQRDWRAREQFAETFLGRTLRCRIQKIEFARPQPRNGFLAVGVGGGQRGGADAHRLGAAQLVVHQCDERRDDDDGAVQRHRG